MNKIKGFSLIELMIALGIVAILFLIIDSIYISLWKTRTMLEQAHETHRARILPQQLFAAQLFHAGHLGCRAIRDGIEIKTSSKLPESFFIHQGQAVRIKDHQLQMHDTFNHTLSVTNPIDENTRINPIELKNKSDWLLISDCLSAELLPYGGLTTQAYQGSIMISPVIIKSWFLKNKTLYIDQVYPPKQAQPILTPVHDWHWERAGSLLRLSWKINEQWDYFVFELGNS